jgi:group I intron endonuclease
MYISRAILKHGISNFSLTILEYCSPDKCIEREDLYLSSVNHEYNILEKAGSSLGYIHSDEFRKKYRMLG